MLNYLSTGKTLPFYLYLKDELKNKALLKTNLKFLNFSKTKSTYIALVWGKINKSI
jgi:hypothetical protein